MARRTEPADVAAPRGDDCCASASEAPLNEAQAGELAAGFAVLADPVRLRILAIVASADAVCSCDLEGPLQRSQPTISHHTKALAAAGLISGEKRGRWTYWTIVPERVDALRDALGGAIGR